MPCTVMNRQRTHRDIDLEKKLESNSEGERVRERRSSEVPRHRDWWPCVGGWRTRRFLLMFLLKGTFVISGLGGVSHNKPLLR